jgi:hypothetical protein
MRLFNQETGSRREAPERAPFHAEDDMRNEIVIGSALCDLKVWTEEEWAALPEHERPLKYVHAPGLGWVGGVPILRLN